MTEEGRLFDSVAGQYAARRPAYPHGAVRWIVGPTAHRVADVGAGTGLLTGQLMRAGHPVIAVEPSPEMGRQLLAALPTAQLRAGSAEDLPLGPGEVDAVVAGSAFHWFKAERALAEASRVLPVGGMLGLIRNVPDERVPWVAALGALTGSTQRRRGRAAVPARPIGFTAVEETTSPHHLTMTGPQLLQLTTTYSYYLTRDASGRAELLARIGDLLEDHPDVAGRPAFDLPFVTHCWRALRR